MTYLHCVFNYTTAEVKTLSEYIPHKNMDVITYFCLNLS